MARFVRSATIVLIVAFAVIGLLGAGRAKAQDAATPVPMLPLAEVTIAVTNGAGSAVSGATISLIRSDDPAIGGTTGSEGNFVFTGLAAGTYAGSVRATGYSEAAIATFELALGDDILIEVTLPPPPPGAILFTVTDENGAALPGADLELYDDTTNEVVTSLTSDSSGQALFGGLQPGLYYATIDADGYDQGLADNIIVQFSTTVDVPVQLEKAPPPTTGTITVEIRFNGESVLSSVTISLYGKTSSSQTRDNNEPVIFANLQPGLYAIDVESVEFGRKTVGPLTVTVGNTLNQIIDLSEPSPGNTGIVIIYTQTQESYPRPLANVQVTVNGTTNNYSRTLVSDGEGTLIFLDVPPDYYLVEALPRDANNQPYDEETTNFHLSGGGVAVKTLRFDGSPAPGTASLAVTVIDEQDQPIVGASVSVESPLGAVPIQTDSSGIALATDLPPGDLTVRASAAGYAESDPVTVTVAVETRGSVTIRLSSAQGPTPTPEPSSEPPTSPEVVVQLPSTGVGTGAAGSWATIALLLIIAAAVAMAVGAKTRV